MLCAGLQWLGSTESLMMIDFDGNLHSASPARHRPPKSGPSVLGLAHKIPDLR